MSTVENALDSIIVKDNFYSDPERIRALALNAEYSSDKMQNFAGKESIKSYFSSGHRDAFSTLIGQEIDNDPEKLVFGKFRIAAQQDKRRTFVHIDRPEWTAVIYLTRDEDCEGGLGFYRHRETGLTLVPTLDELGSLGYSSLDDFDERLVCRDTLESGAWEQIKFVPMQFNRLVLFPGARFFHAATDIFGDADSKARISQHFFFNGASVSTGAQV